MDYNYHTNMTGAVAVAALLAALYFLNSPSVYL